jgi:AbrB family looped-hinge helix DNA binding protein
MITSKLTAKAQTTIPRAVRRHLGVAEGDLLGFVVEGERVVLCKPLLRGPVSPAAAPLVMSEWESEADKRAFQGL